jgi:hypothetical protein
MLDMAGGTDRFRTHGVHAEIGLEIMLRKRVE